ncbi:hypothetical protein [Chlamydia vaughanii]|uniref:hypothetical protein n=1 Tax=Chlamydia vaughanii TaxID=3112552 RepID=UPI0032B2C10B
MSSSHLISHPPLGVPFRTGFSHRNYLMNLFGAIPIVGIFVGAKRIAAVADYCGELSERGLSCSPIIIKKIGGGLSEVQDQSTYKAGHYFRGVMEILGLGSVILIAELAITLLEMLLGVIILFACVASLLTIIPLTVIYLFIKYVVSSTRFAIESDSAGGEKGSSSKGKFLEKINLEFVKNIKWEDLGTKLQNVFERIG